MDTYPRTAAVFCSSYKLPKTVTVTMFLLYGSVTLLIGIFLCIKLSNVPVNLTSRTIYTLLLCAAGLSIHTGSVHQ